MNRILVKLSLMEEKTPLARLTSDNSNDEIKKAAFVKLTKTMWTCTFSEGGSYLG